MEKTWKIDLGSIDLVPVGQGQSFILYGDEIAVFRDRTGKFFGVENRCPHRRGPLAEGVMGNGKVVCPLHGHKFDLATGEGSDKQECVRTFKVWEEYGRLVIEYYKLPKSEVCSIS
jgi:nitrite reductase (NADH) small subunit